MKNNVKLVILAYTFDISKPKDHFEKNELSFTNLSILSRITLLIRILQYKKK